MEMLGEGEGTNEEQARIWGSDHLRSLGVALMNGTSSPTPREI